MSEPTRQDARLDQPREQGRRWQLPAAFSSGAFGTASEAFARFMGTPAFLIGMTIFCAVWLGWNTFMPEQAQFDPRSLNYTLLTLILSLQASYAAPLLLLAQNRQDDRDRVIAEQDRSRDERNLADTEYLTREVAALRVAMRDVATRDYLRSELRELLEELTADREDAGEENERPRGKKSKNKRREPPRPPRATPGTSEETTAATPANGGADTGNDTGDGDASAATAASPPGDAGRSGAPVE